MTRHQRRKLARARKDAKAEKLNARALALLQSEKLKRNLAERRPKCSERGMGNRGIYQGFALYPAPGYGTGAFKDKPLSERALRDIRSRERG
jgi:hypothetical protein